jgi:hypothetical protein
MEKLGLIYTGWFLIVYNTRKDRVILLKLSQEVSYKHAVVTALLVRYGSIS